MSRQCHRPRDFQFPRTFEIVATILLLFLATRCKKITDPRRRYSVGRDAVISLRPRNCSHFFPIFSHLVGEKNRNKKINQNDAQP